MTYRKYAATFPTLLMLACCQGVQVPASDAASQIVAPSPQQLEIIKAGVARGLRDPASAQFGSMIVGRSPDGHYPTCGYVNAKNGYGGYTGMTPFMGAIRPDGNFELGGLGGTDIETLSVRQVCAKYGLPI